ncbi:acyltransferase family protein [Marimonas lutisalis]|uniref:acyltransferase family protein n=1 Tax=Marimonas lutisalis TaxID=2545756 RepID=UPI0010F96732|nr:acyltransferase family protein [Marimonas lutisalis]
MTYRPEIDGLRAIAVMAVILFHAGFDLFSGGYVGVDVFFVISGYLITSLILKDLEKGCFSFGHFYERRARRILPSLTVVILVSIPFAWAWMLPSQFQEFSGSLFSIGFFLSNFYFLSQLEYFQPSSELQPMLHTWSLSIEEQYYLIFPALLFSLARFGRLVLFAVILLSVLGGIFLAHVGVTDDPGKNYFHSAARLWEIGAGALCAFLPNRRRIDALGLAGLSLISYAVFGFDSNTPFPSLFTLVPIAGTMLLVLFADHTGIVGRILANRAMVGGGLVSYSAYLWHQPLFAFARLRSLHDPGPGLLVALIAATLVLAALSWRFVEMPFRRRPSPLLKARGPYMAASLGLMVAISAGGLWGYLQNGFPDRKVNGVALAELDTRLRPNMGLDENCTGGFTSDPACATSDEPEVILWGDSYAMHLVPALLAANPGIKLRQHTYAGCAPLLDVAFRAHSLGFVDTAGCFQFNRDVLDDLDRQTSLRTIVLSSPFSLYEKALWNADGTRLVGEDAFEAVVASLENTVRRLKEKGLEVLIVSPPPMEGIDLGQCAARVVRFGAQEDACDFEFESTRNREVFRIMDRISAVAPVLRLDEAICVSGRCDTIRDGIILFRDDGHLTIEGSQTLGQRIQGFNLDR